MHEGLLKAMSVGIEWALNPKKGAKMKKFILNTPGHKWVFEARDIQEAEEIVLSGLELDEDDETPDEDPNAYKRGIEDKILAEIDAAERCQS